VKKERVENMQEPSELRAFGDEALVSEGGATLSMTDVVLPAEEATARTTTYDSRHVTFLFLFLTLVCLLLAVL
jgi:hypothetical protein